MYYIAGTGTRSIVLDSKLMIRVTDKLVEMLEAKLLSYPDLNVISGVAEGLDEAIARAAVMAAVPFHAYIPNKGYGDYYWRRNSQTGEDRSASFQYYLDSAASIRYITDSIYRDGVHSNFWRNMAMVDDADEVWAYDDGVQDGGTGHCVKYAKSKKVPITIIRLP